MLGIHFKMSSLKINACNKVAVIIITNLISKCTTLQELLTNQN